MRVFTKRIIWLFGIWLLDELSALVFYITHNIPINEYPPYQDFYGIYNFIMLGIYVIPLFFMKDDIEEKRVK